MLTDNVTRIPDRQQAMLPDIPSEADKAKALAANLRERARIVELAGDPVVQTFDHPTFHQLQAVERSQADNIAEFAALAIFGTHTSDRLTPKQGLALEGAAMYLVRRIHPEWMQAAHEQAVETLLVTDEFRIMRKFLSEGQVKVMAERCTQSILAALIGTLENERSVAPATYLKLQAARAEAGAL